MPFDHDIALAERDTGGLAPAEDLAPEIPYVGFDADADEFADVAFIGFAEDTEASQDAAVAPPARARRRRLGEAARRAAFTAWAAALALQRRLLGSHLSIRRLRAAIVPAIAVLVAVGIGLTLRSWLPARQPAEIVKAPPAAPAGPAIAVARRPIGRGGLVMPADIEWQPWPPAALKRSYFRQGTRHLADLQGYVARRPIAVGQPLSTLDIVAPAGRGFMAAMLQPGMRAVSVAIGPETAASGLIVPGDAVDVLLSLPVPAFNAGGTIAAHERASVAVLLQHVRVLAIDQQTDGRPGQAIVGQAATLEVTPKQAEIVTLANELALRGGMLVLTLRSLRGEAAAPAAGAAVPSHLLDIDVSKLLTDRPVALPPTVRPLAILRRATLSQP